MSSGAPLGRGLYFIDVLSCLVFGLTLALATARFGTEQTVEIELPEAERVQSRGSQLTAREIRVRSDANGVVLELDGELLSFEELEVRLRDAPPPAVVVRSEASVLGRVMALAHAAGVRDVELAYEAVENRGGRR